MREVLDQAAVNILCSERSFNKACKVYNDCTQTFDKNTPGADSQASWAVELTGIAEGQRVMKPEPRYQDLHLTGPLLRWCDWRGQRRGRFQAYDDVLSSLLRRSRHME